jgi:murein DD-endopeptidase MepM/ murein hydrolase activator NlpD
MPHDGSHPCELPNVMLLSPAALLIAKRCTDVLRRHPRRLTGVVLGLLAGFAITAFGIAPLAPDAALLPQRLISESIAVPDLTGQVQALSEVQLHLNASGLTRANDNPSTLLRRLGISDAEATAFLRSDPLARKLFEGRAGKMVQAQTSADGGLTQLVARYPSADPSKAASHFSRLSITRAGGRLTSRLELALLERKTRLGSGSVQTSLWAATDDAKLPDAIATQLIEIFSGDIDFHRQLRKGDAFSVVYEGLTADDQPVNWNDGMGRILAAEFINSGKVSQAVWFDDAKSGKGGYFSPEGRSRKRPFLASPLAFSRITSGFAMRFHPILQDWRAHHGVDYGAPKGTAVKVVGEGVVEFAGRQGGYGNVIQVLHAGGKSTVYAHLSKMEVRKGQRVEQGQRIGAVGATGWATGPHLHFELRVNGEYRDPLTVARTSENITLDAAAKVQFLAQATSIQHQLKAANSLTTFRGDAE